MIFDITVYTQKQVCNHFTLVLFVVQFRNLVVIVFFKEIEFFVKLFVLIIGLPFVLEVDYIHFFGYFLCYLFVLSSLTINERFILLTRYESLLKSSKLSRIKKLETIQSQINPGLMINVIHRDQFFIEKQNEEMESQIIIQTHDQFISWLEKISPEESCSDQDKNLLSVQDLLYSNYKQLFSLGKTSKILKTSFICNYQDQGNKMLFHLCSFVHGEEINHQLSFHSCEKELQIFQLKKKDQEKDILMASMLHDQKTPLVSSQFYIKKSMDKLFTLIQPQKIEGLSIYHIRDILNECYQDIKIGHNCLDILEQVAKGILDYSLIRLDKVNCQYTEFTISSLIQKLQELMQFKFDLKGIKLKFKNKLSNTHQEIYNDQQHLIQSIFNLLTNALKFTESGSVTILFTDLKDSFERHYIQISVSDTGSGISPQIISKLNQVFQTFSNKGCKNEEGIGLGLYNIQNFIRYMGNDNQILQINNNKEKGAKFSFNFFVDVKQKQQQINSNGQMTIFDSCDDNDSEYDGSKSKRSLNKTHNSQMTIQNNNSDSKQSNSFEFTFRQNSIDSPPIIIHMPQRLKMKNIFKQNVANQRIIEVMIAEDDAINMLCLTIQLNKISNLEFKITKCWDGKQCIEKFKVNQFQLIFLDYNMPFYNGIECARELRNIENQYLISENTLEKSIIIGFSSLEKEIIEEKFLKEKVDCVLTKPTQLNELQKILCGYFATQNQND